MDIHERNLPHWQQNDCWTFVTRCLADARPIENLAKWSPDKEALRLRPEPLDEAAQRAFHQRFSAQIDTQLASGLGACVPAKPSVRKILVDELMNFDGSRIRVATLC